MDTERWEQKQAARRARWEERASRHRYSSGTHGIFFGAIVVAIGCLLLLDNLGIVRFHDIWQYWPVLLVAYGVSRIVDARTPSGYVWGGVSALIGAFLLLDTLDIIVFSPVRIAGDWYHRHFQRIEEWQRDPGFSRRGGHGGIRRGALRLAKRFHDRG